MPQTPDSGLAGPKEGKNSLVFYDFDFCVVSAVVLRRL